ncbi:unnamed protein product [Paramecium primaurelia]|uniref:PCI domain-containing protein n=1 Tax=Paramecium primaurelia TaxID=5886 RepID=A0A8S1JX22_PARPR|nr:unnamed protein product [Paramecium primaurelia]
MEQQAAATQDKTQIQTQASSAQQPQAQAQKPKTVLSEIKLQILLLEKAVSSKDIKAIQKVSIFVKKFRNTVKSHHLAKLFNTFFPNVAVQQGNDFDANFTEDLGLSAQVVSKLTKIIEVNVFIQCLYLIWLFQQKQSEAYEQVNVLGKQLLQQVQQNNKRYLDTLLGVIYEYLSKSHEKLGKLNQIRDVLFEGYRNACQNRDENGQAILINLILRNFIHYNQYEQSYNFLKKTEFPEHAFGNQQARFLYYTGLIHAIRGEYQEAYKNLTQASHKAPDNTAFGFKVQAIKVIALVELLLGNVPNRDTFTSPEYQQALYPYYRIVSTVIKGNLGEFQQEVARSENILRRDKLYNLIQRLPQIVIKAGLRRINLSYSRISLNDIHEKLNLPSQCNAEQVVAKAIRDGTLAAVIDHENQIVITKETNDLYGTKAPQEAYGERINNCLGLYNQAVKALQYQNPEYDYGEKQADDELTTDELLSLAELDF